LKESLSRRVVWCVLLLASALSLLVAVWVARQSLIIGSRAGEWVYPYNAPFRVEALWI